MLKVVPLVLLLVAAGPAMAGPQEDADAAIARGVALRKADNNAGALEEFQRANTLYPTPKSQAQIGLALQAMGRWTEAEPFLTSALAATSDPWIGKNRRPLESALATVSSRLGSLEIFGTPAGAQVVVEQRAVGVLPLPKPVRATAGTVPIEVRAPGYLPLTRNVVVAAGALSRETINLARDNNSPAAVTTAAPVATAGGVGSLTAPTPAESTPVLIETAKTPEAGGTSKPLYRRWWFWTGVGVAAAAVATTVLVAGSSESPCGPNIVFCEKL